MAITKSIKPRQPAHRMTKQQRQRHEQELAEMDARAIVYEAERMAEFKRGIEAKAAAALQREHEQIGGSGELASSPERAVPGYVESLRVLADLRDFQHALRTIDDRVAAVLVAYAKSAP